MEQKWKMKKMAAVILAVMLAAGTLAGCGSSGGTSQSETTTQSAAPESAQAQTEAAESTAAEQTEAAGETSAQAGEGIPLDAFAGTTLTIVRTKPEMDYSENTNDKLICQMAEEATGIHVEWIDIPSMGANEKISVMLASGDMPDVFLGGISESTIANDPDLFYDLSEEGLLETYAPNAVADIIASFSNGLEAITWPDGSIRSLPGGNSTNRNNDAYCKFWINKSWLDQVGMEVPTTTDELFEVLRAFRDNDMDGDGDPSNEIPMSFADNRWAREFSNTANFFGIAGENVGYAGIYYMLKDGVVMPMADTQQWRDWLEWGNQMIREGLLDLEGFSQSTEQYNAKIGQGIVGVYPAFSPKELSEDYLESWMLLWPMRASEETEMVKTGHLGNNEASSFTFIVSADSPNVKAALHWWNYLNSSHEMKAIMGGGVPTGESYEYNGHTYPIMVDNTTIPERSSYNATEISQTFGLDPVRALRTPSQMTPYGIVWNYEKGEVEQMPPESLSGRQNEILDMLDPYLPKEYMPRRIIDPDRTLQRTQIEVELMTYINNFVTNSVVNGITDKTWDAYVTGLEGVGYYDWIQWQQDYYDGK